MEDMEEIRLEALKALTVLVIHDEQFRRSVWDDPEGTITRYGFALNEREMAKVRDFRQAIADSVEEDVVVGLTSSFR
ncbi:MAG: hypothetical protein M3317_00400 [Actinomycetota bacterium]|nr:hypothetical protein [Actinomycetota bacterium]